MMTRQNLKLNETYLKVEFDWVSAESSVAQEVTPVPEMGSNPPTRSSHGAAAD